MSENLHFSPVITQKASEVIFDQIRAMILSGGLRPGDKLPSERALMQQLERSRPTIREALRMLENAGLIRIIPGGGAVVASPSSASVRQPLEQLVAMREITNEELLEFRSLNEMALAAWAAQRRTEEDLRALKRCIREAAEQINDFDRFIQLDILFHATLADAAKNRMCGVVEKVIHQMVNDILSRAFSAKSEAEQQQMCREILSSHERIVAAIEAHDEASAQALMQEHLHSFESDILLTGGTK